LSDNRDKAGRGEGGEGKTKLTRREFLKLGVTAALSAALLSAVEDARRAKPLFKHLRTIVHRRAERMYAGRVAYDYYVRSTCAGNCTQACGFKAYVRDGIIVGLAPAADYHVYDPVAGQNYNPRGCERGASYVRYIYGPARVLHPYKRVGKRGEGKFKRITWDQAAREIADKVLEIVSKDGGDAIAFFSPIPAYNYISAGSGYRLANLLGASGPLSFYDWYSDLPPGEPITWGTQTEESEEWDWKHARLLVL
jgi:nitrate reductase alpha subunit